MYNLRPVCAGVFFFGGAGGWTPGGAVVKNPPAKAGDTGSIPGSEGSLVVGNSNPYQYSCLKNSMDRGACQAIDHRVSKSQI